MSDKLKELHGVLAEELLKRVKDPEAKSSDLNVARQFLRDNGIDAVPTQHSPLTKLIEELPFDEKPKTSISQCCRGDTPIFVSFICCSCPKMFVHLLCIKA